MHHADPKHVSQVSLGETFVPDVTMTMDEAERMAEAKQREQQRASAEQKAAGAGNAPAAPGGE
ncbi:MAG: hypothetical protein JWN15_2032 [Firmicutes bacterium]|nr:hypothetical protein [Bacillota bacterium]